tara:strand:- start:996 stop:1352 length:357 start_codon:yes stop_codon:yes gene_type:complete
MEDRRGWPQWISDLISGVSFSEYKGAHQDIDKLIERADEDALLAKLFPVDDGRNTGAVYRHLNPNDSTVTLLQGMVDRYYRSPIVPLEDMIRRDALGNIGEPISQDYAASLLARLRNE